MYRVKTFGTEMKPFHVHRELERLDTEVNGFFDAHPEYELLGVNDMAVADENGVTQGMIRVVAYKA